MVKAVEAALSKKERAEFVARSSAITDAFCAAMQASDRAAALSALNDAGDILEELGAKARVPVVTPKLARIQKLGRAHGLAAKVSGAGGGDGALFAGFDAGALRAALAEAEEAGFYARELAISAGLAIEAQSEKG